MESTKDKIDKALGLSPGQTIDDLLGDMTSDLQKAEDTFNTMSTEMQSCLDDVDEQLGIVQSGNSSPLVLQNLDSSMKEVEELIQMSKAMFKHVYENVVSSELCDSELIGSVSKLLESIHINIAEFISMYRDKERFIEKVKFSLIQQNLKKELMDKKQQQAIELLKMKAEDKVVDVDANANGGAMSQEEMIKILQNMGDQQVDALIESKGDSEIEQSSSETKEKGNT